MAQYTHRPAAATAAVNTVAAATDVPHEIVSIEYSYGGTGTLSGGNLNVQSPSGTIIWQVAIEAKGPGQFTFDTRSIVGAKGQAMIVTLASGGADVVGSLNTRTRS